MIPNGTRQFSTSSETNESRIAKRVSFIAKSSRELTINQMLLITYKYYSRHKRSYDEDQTKKIMDTLTLLIENESVDINFLYVFDRTIRSASTLFNYRNSSTLRIRSAKQTSHVYHVLLNGQNPNTRYEIIGGNAMRYPHGLRHADSEQIKMHDDKSP